MSYLAANSYAVIEATVTLPRSGAWHADLLVDVQNEAEVSGPISLTVGDLISYEGTAVRPPSVFADSVRVRMVGGLGMLGKSYAKPKSYRGVPLKLVLQDIVRDAGEALSPRCDAGLLAARLSAWTTIRQPAGEALALLLRAADGAVWRILPDGTVWAGYEVWPASDGTEYVVTDEDDAQGVMKLASEAPAILPGLTVLGRKISRVTHHWRASEMTSTAHWEVA